ncbi:MAG: hypothetical protein ABIH23_04420, partial [bacterium]
MTAVALAQRSADPLWPQVDPAAYHGLSGEFVRIIEPHSEADPIAIQAQLLTIFGNMIGRNAHYRVEGDRHYTNIFTSLIGNTSKARKGTSYGQTRRIFESVEADYFKNNVAHGLSSGEGLKFAVRDAVEKAKGKVADNGIEDKRLLVVEQEFAQVLKVLQREGNTLSPTIRCAWDTGNLRTLTKTDPIIATGAHISIISHITCDELKKHL